MGLKLSRNRPQLLIISMPWHSLPRILLTSLALTCITQGC